MTESLSKTEPLASSSTSRRLRGGGFLIEERLPEEIFTPEDFSEQHRLIAETTERFMRSEVLPRVEQLEHQEPGLTERLLRQAGELGLLSIDIPERYGGMELDIASSMAATERIAQYASFAASYGAHSGIGTLPIVFFGTEAQKQKYLPRLATGELIAAYCLSEASSGSDALACRARATLSPDGKHYLLNGEKMWITNAGFAGVFIVFAKVDGEKFSCFIVERVSPGLSTGAEEKKMGLKGSSTRALILENVAVPVENLLGEVGRGHTVAFNILNIGRLRLGAGCVGGAKQSLQNAVAYAKQRRAFGKPIAEFGLIQEKLAEMATRIYAAESVLYRTVGLIDHAMVESETGDTVCKAVEEYAVECSINKVFGSEMLDYVVDECVQIHGGYGYHQDYPAERSYRDSRINRVFEGTNEINRLVIANILFKRAMSGQLDLMSAAKKLMQEALSAPPAAADSGGPLDKEKRLAAAAKKVALMVSAAAYQRYQASLAEEQEIVAAISDIVASAFAMESITLRASKMLMRGGSEEQKAAFALAMARLFVHSQMEFVEQRARTALAAIASGDKLRSQLAMIRRFCLRDPVDAIHLRREIARRIIDQEKYAV